MRVKFGFLIVASALAGCTHPNRDVPEAGLAAVNVPMVTRADYALDLAAPGGSLGPSEAQRLDSWFRSLQLRYGDVVYVDGPYADMARAQVSQVAGNYGLMVSNGAPVTPGAIGSGTVRVVVSRTEASVPGCPNWSQPSSPNYENRSMPNYGCAVNGNLAAMVANPGDLVFGRATSETTDPRTAIKPVTVYRTAPTTGAQGLQDINTKKDDQ